jgi:hypothetical protein
MHEPRDPYADLHPIYKDHPDIDVPRTRTSAAELSDDDLKTVYAWLWDYLCGLKWIDTLPPLDNIGFNDVGKAREQTMVLLETIAHNRAILINDPETTDGGEEGIAWLDYPEYKLVLRLRRLGVSWAKIAEKMDVSTAGLWKRYKRFVDHADEEVTETT